MHRALGIAVVFLGCSHPKAPVPPIASGPLAEGVNYRVDRGPVGACASGAPCEAKVVLTARAGYHVNPEYPYKFIADPSSDLATEGTGTFTVDDELHGTLTLTVRPAKAGTLTLAGTFRLSVCTPEDCAVEAPKIALEIRAAQR